MAYVNQQQGGGQFGGQYGSQQQQVVVVQQPGSIQGQQGGQPQNIRGWSSGLCGCCEDIGGCLYGYFCMMCMLCTIASKLDESCCVPLCLQGGTYTMRTKLRTQYGISGSICSDCCTVSFCGALAVCQMYRELKSLGR